jgi:hypothetical protein
METKTNTRQLPKVSTRYGAPMGRADSRIAGKCRLQRIHLNSGGYDSGGAYWGHGKPLWVAMDSDGGMLFCRANTREQAKGVIAGSMLSDSVTFYK